MSNHLTEPQRVGGDLVEVCQAGGKIVYATKREAKEAAVVLRLVHGGPLRIYHCAVCRRYHLTSRGHARGRRR